MEDSSKRIIEIEQVSQDEWTELDLLISRVDKRVLNEESVEHDENKEEKDLKSEVKKRKVNLTNWLVPKSDKQVIPLEGGHLEYYPQFLSSTEANKIMNILCKDTPWKQEEVLMMGKLVKPSRNIAIYGDEGVPYRYSGVTKTASGWHKDLKIVKDKVQECTSQPYNYALLNYYRNGKDYIGYHSDDERDLISGSSIASLSLGAERTFIFKSRKNSEITKSMELANGSLLVMMKDTQKNWKHSLPKRLKIQQSRLNITFRWCSDFWKKN